MWVRGLQMQEKIVFALGFLILLTMMTGTECKQPSWSNRDHSVRAVKIYSFTSSRTRVLFRWNEKMPFWKSHGKNAVFGSPKCMQLTTLPILSCDFYARPPVRFEGIAEKWYKTLKRTSLMNEATSLFCKMPARSSFVYYSRSKRKKNKSKSISS